MKKEAVSMVAVLACICIVVSALLGYVNSITKDKIAAISFEKMQNAMADIMPGCTFEEIALDKSSSLDALYTAKDSGNNTVGICSKVTVSGFANDIVLIVGVNDDGTVAGVRITEINETAGLGSRTNDPDWLKQFNGLSGKINLVRKATTSPTDVVAVSGATISSTAVTKGVQTVLNEAIPFLGGAKQ